MNPLLCTTHISILSFKTKLKKILLSYLVFLLLLVLLLLLHYHNHSRLYFITCPNIEHTYNLLRFNFVFNKYFHTIYIIYFRLNI